MPSANQSIGSNGVEFLVDGTERTITLLSRGGYVCNTGTVDFYVNFEGAAVVITQPGGAGNIRVSVGATVPIPSTVGAFKIKSTAGDTYATVTPL